METANTNLMLILADARRSDLERRATVKFSRFNWLERRRARAQRTPRPSVPLTRRKAY